MEYWFKHSTLILIVGLCAFLHVPAPAYSASKVAYYTHVTDEGTSDPVPSKQYWTQGSDVPSSTKTYHSPEVALSATTQYPHHQEFSVAPFQLSISPLSQLTYFRSRPRDPPAL